MAADLQVSLHMYQERDFISMNVGETVTLPCFSNHSTARLFFWYKQTLGQKLILIVKFYKYNNGGEFSDEFRNSRYSLEAKDGKFDLTISDLQISDSATYFCMGSSAHMVGFGEGITVDVKGSGWDIKALVHQSASEIFQSEDKMNQRCTIYTSNSNGKQSFYWYKSSEEPNLGLLHLDESMNDQQETNPNPRTCMYHQQIENRTHTGANICAVASCGHVLFERGPKLKDEASPPSSLVYILSGASVFNIILSFLLAFFVYKVKKRDHCQCTGSPTTTLGPATTHVQGYQDADCLHYAALRKQTFNRPRRQTDDTFTECVYSGVKQ